MLISTNVFVSKLFAVRYYGQDGLNYTEEDVNEKIKNEEIKIGYEEFVNLGYVDAAWFINKEGRYVAVTDNDKKEFEMHI